MNPSLKQPIKKIQDLLKHLRCLSIDRSNDWFMKNPVKKKRDESEEDDVQLTFSADLEG